MPVPIEVIFNPNWWFRNYGISFEQPFYFDRAARIENDVRMRRALWERFGIGERDPEPRPVIGSMHVAGGFAVPALLGVEIRFFPNGAPFNVPANLSRERIMALRVPEIESTWPIRNWIDDMDALEKEFGYVVGDFNLGGLINTAIELRGQQFFADLLEDPELVAHLFNVVAETQARVAAYVRGRTGTNSIAVNRSIVNVDPAITVNCHCSTQMISPAVYERTMQAIECAMAERLQPFGIHHCGNNLHLFASRYMKTGLVFCDVGWGSDAALCRERMPGVFLNLRLSPVRMLQEDAATIHADAERLLAAAPENSGLCCINMDAGTPDENLLAMFAAAKNAIR